MQQNQTESTPYKSELARLIEQRERKLYEFDVQGFFGLSGEAITKAAIWVSRKNEENAAVEAAHRRVENCPENARQDPDLLTDAKAIEIIVRAFRDPANTAEGGTPYPLFPGPAWAHENFTTDQIATLLNLYNEVRKKEGPQLWDLDDGMLEAMIVRCSEHIDDDLPEAVLAQCPREWLTQAFILVAHKLVTERAERIMLLDRAEEAAAQANRMEPVAAAATALLTAIDGGSGTEQIAALVQGVREAAEIMIAAESIAAPDGES